MLRRAVVAGQFYSSSFDSLEKEIKECFLSKFGPGNLPQVVKKKRARVIGALAPHAGYMFSGPAAAHLYLRIYKASKKQKFVIVGPNHTGLGSGISIMLAGEWETPLGRVEIDSSVARKIIESSRAINSDLAPFLYEHSIEVQLPFLQFLYRNDFSFVPICVTNFDFKTCKEVASSIARVKDVCLIASSDMTHYGPSYGFLPFVENVKEKLYDLDRKAIDQILKLNARSFLEIAKQTTICGAGPIAMMILAAKELGAKKGELLSYYTSGDVIGDYRNAVGYASLALI